MKKYFNLFIVAMLTMLVSILAFGQAAPVVAAPSIFDKLGAYADQAIAFIQSLGNGTIFMIITAAFEMLLRLMKTSKPMDILRLIKAGLDKAASFVPIISGLVNKVGSILLAVSQFLDKILGQNVSSG